MGQEEACGEEGEGGEMMGVAVRKEKIEGYLEVGLNDNFEVVINYFAMTPDENGDGHIVFSPNQARALARILQKQAREAELEIEARWGKKKPAAKKTKAGK